MKTTYFIYTYDDEGLLILFEYRGQQNDLRYRIINSNYLDFLDEIKAGNTTPFSNWFIMIMLFSIIGISALSYRRIKLK